MVHVIWFRLKLSNLALKFLLGLSRLVIELLVPNIKLLHLLLHLLYLRSVPFLHGFNLETQLLFSCLFYLE